MAKCTGFVVVTFLVVCLEASFAQKAGSARRGGNQKFADPCSENSECGFDGAVCDPKQKSCRCAPDLPATDHVYKCGKNVAMNESCVFNEQCDQNINFVDCIGGKCGCCCERILVKDKDGDFKCVEIILSTTIEQEPETRPMYGTYQRDIPYGTGVEPMKHRVISCKVLPPSSSSFQEEINLFGDSRLDSHLRLLPLRQYFDTEVTSTNGFYLCGFALSPVKKSDEGKWTLVYEYETMRRPQKKKKVELVQSLEVPDKMHAFTDPFSATHTDEGGNVTVKLFVPVNTLGDGELNATTPSCTATYAKDYISGSKTKSSSAQVHTLPLTGQMLQTNRKTPVYTERKTPVYVEMCHILLQDVQMEDRGVWYLTAIHNATGLPYEAKLYVDVDEDIFERVEPSSVVANLGETVTLEMKTSRHKRKRLLNECIVISPNGTEYKLKTAETTDIAYPSIVYVGRGLAEGDCGAKIGPLTSDFNGDWMFKISLPRRYNNIPLRATAKITVTDATENLMPTTTSSD